MNSLSYWEITSPFMPTHTLNSFAKLSFSCICLSIAWLRINQSICLFHSWALCDLQETNQPCWRVSPLIFGLHSQPPLEMPIGGFHHLPLVWSSSQIILLWISQLNNKGNWQGFPKIFIRTSQAFLFFPPLSQRIPPFSQGWATQLSPGTHLLGLCFMNYYVFYYWNFQLQYAHLPSTETKPAT